MTTYRWVINEISGEFAAFPFRIVQEEFILVLITKGNVVTTEDLNL